MDFQATDFDTIVIGGGPAGSSAGAKLAQAGQRVLVAEKSNFAPYRIGESLLPNGNALLKSVGAWDKIEAAGFIRKYGAEFETADGEKKVHNVFARGLNPNDDYTYQAERPRFDALLLEHAQESGCQIDQAANIVQVDSAPTHYTLHAEDGRRWTCRWLIDASGRRRILGKLWKLPSESNPYPSRIAVYNHFENVERSAGKEGGNIIITRRNNGWFWSIPINATTTSVGFVSLSADLKDSKLKPAAWFQQNRERSPAVVQRMKDATALGEYRTTTDYSYIYQDFCGERFFLVGDAATFSDPIFSSGVYLGMESALAAAQSILKADSQRRALTAKERLQYTNELKDRTKVMRQLIDTFYDDAGFAVFMNPTDKFKLFAAVNSIVAGNTRPGFNVRWRYLLFRCICYCNKSYRLIPPVLPRRRKAC